MCVGGELNIYGVCVWGGGGVEGGGSKFLVIQYL